MSSSWTSTLGAGCDVESRRQARRAIIKFFYRRYSSLQAGAGLAQNITAAIRGRVQQLFANYTNASSYGCFNATAGRCSPAYCTLANGYTPCLDAEFALTSVDVTQLVMSMLMAGLKGFYANVTQVRRAPPYHHTNHPRMQARHHAM